MMQLMLSPLAQTIFSIIAVLCYVACAFRILCFDRLHLQKCSFRLFSAVLIGAFLTQSIHIIFIKDPVTIWDAIFAVCSLPYRQLRKQIPSVLVGTGRSLPYRQLRNVYL